MMRYIDRMIVTIAGLVLVAFIGYHTYDIVARIKHVNAEVNSARSLKARADDNDLRIPPEDASQHSGRVFKVWEEMPLANRFHAADFHPDAR